MPEKRKAAAAETVRRDAKGQFVRDRKHGRDNNGVMSAEPRVLDNDDDATFEGDPDRDG